MNLNDKSYRTGRARCLVRALWISILSCSWGCQYLCSPVSFRSFRAFFLSITGAYVSGKHKVQSTKRKNTRIASRYSVPVKHCQLRGMTALRINLQRHPRLELSDKAAPIIGPTVGPPEMHNATNVMAFPRVAGSNMSPKAAGTLLIGAEAKIPPKNRVIKMLSAFLLVAVPILKSPSMKTAGSIPMRRP